MAPANNQPLLSDGKKLTIAALAVAGLFLLCYGTGESTVVIAGLGVLVGLGGPILIIVSTSRAAKRTYVFGTAHVHDVSGLPTAGNTGRIQMQLIINARGIDGVPVMMRDNSVPANKWPDVGATLPVRVLETNPSKVTVLWDQVRTHGEVSRGEQRYPGFSPPAPRDEPDPVVSYTESTYTENAYDDDRHAIADEDDYDDGPLPPDDRPTRTDLPPIRVDESTGGSPVAVMDRQVVEISPTPGSSYPGYPYEEHAAYSPTYPAPSTSPPDESDISPFDLTPQDLPAASATSSDQAAPRVSSRRRPSPYRRKPGNRPSTRPTASAPFRTGTPEDEAPATDQAPQDEPEPEGTSNPVTVTTQDEADLVAPEAEAQWATSTDTAGGIPATADRETDWAPFPRPQTTPQASPTETDPAIAPSARETAWAEIDQPAPADSATDWPQPAARETAFAEPTGPEAPNVTGSGTSSADPTHAGTDWPEPIAPPTTTHETTFTDPPDHETGFLEPADPRRNTDRTESTGNRRETAFAEPPGTGRDAERAEPTGTSRDGDLAQPTATGRDADWAESTGTGRETGFGEPADPRPDADGVEPTGTNRETGFADPRRDTNPADPTSASRETDWPEPAGPEAGANGTTFAGTAPAGRETDWADPAETDWAEPAETDWAEPAETGWPEPAAPETAERETAWPEPAGGTTPSGAEVLEGDVGWPEPTGRVEPGQPRSAWNNGWARTVWPHPDRPETAPEEPDLPDGLDSDDEALEGGVFDPSGYATDSPDDAAAHIETLDDSYAMPDAYGIPEGGADIYVPDPYVSETYDPEPDRPVRHEEINGHAVEIVAPPTEPYHPDDTTRQPSPIDELFAPWPEPAQRPTGRTPDDDTPSDQRSPAATPDTDNPAPDAFQGNAIPIDDAGLTDTDQTADTGRTANTKLAEDTGRAADTGLGADTAPGADTGLRADTALGTDTDRRADTGLASDTDETVEGVGQLDDEVVGRRQVEVDPADVLEPEPDGGQVARFLPASPKETVLPLANPAVHGISVTLQVSDLQRSRRFYKDKLGLQELDSSLSSAVLQSGEARVLLRQVAHMPPVDRRTVHLHLEVPDVYEAYERLRADGVEFVHRPRVVPQGEQIDLCTATFRDPDGHAVELSRWELRR